MDLVARFSENMSAKCSAVGKGRNGTDEGKERDGWIGTKRTR